VEQLTPTTKDDAAAIELTAVVVAVTAEEPRVLTIEDANALPSGPFTSSHRTLQMGLRSWVERQTHHPLGYVEQLYTFADRDRTRGGAGERLVSISYLGLTREEPATGQRDPRWQSWYRYLPWEDWRGGPPALVARAIVPRLRQWVTGAEDATTRRERRNRIEVAFGLGGHGWNEELTLQRYELLHEAGMVSEATRRGTGANPLSGAAMHHDHRRILATAIARLRAKIKYRPVVFELMPESFTLLALQRSVEALAGQRLHKQNFRRLIDQQGLVEETGEMSRETGGRPARLVRFRREVLIERAVVGTKLPLSRPG
jgi:hypothetical protein